MTKSDVITSMLCFRLFYLHHEKIETYLKEESVFKCLTWFIHTICGLTISVIVGDNLFNAYDSSIIHLSCGTMPKWFLVGKSFTIYNELVIKLCVIYVTIVFVDLIIQFAIFITQKRLKIMQCFPKCFAPCFGNDYHILKVHGYNRKLWRFGRNVVSPIGSFLSFLAGVSYNLLLTYAYISGHPQVGELLIFSVHYIHFFCFNLIETLSSPTLRNSLITKILWFRNEHYVVNV